jgi:hypothetical protein
MVLNADKTKSIIITGKRLKSRMQLSSLPLTASDQPRTQALWFVYVIKRKWEGTRGRKMENSAGSAW